MIDQLQITRAADDSFVLSAVKIGEMPELFTARNSAEMAARARELFDGPVSDVPFMIQEAFERDHVTAVRSVQDLLDAMMDGDEDDEPEAEGALADPLDPGWRIF